MLPDSRIIAQVLTVPIDIIPNYKNMATNPPKGSGRVGAVKGREQVYNPKIDRWTKTNDATGRFMDQKADPKPFKGVRKNK